MGRPLKQEILAPIDRDDRGRFSDGNRAGQGAPPGTQALRQTMRSMILESFDMVGGPRYLAMQALLNPAAYLGLLGRVVPLKIEADPSEGVREIRHSVVFPALPPKSSETGDND